MKLKILAAVCVVTTGVASAYTVSVTNQIAFGNPSLPIVDNTGTPITAGVVAVGFFGADDDVNSEDFAALLTSFNQYGSNVPLVQGAAPGLFDIDTPDAWKVAVPSGTTGGQVGQSVYVLIGNADSLANSTQMAVWKSSNSFATEDELGNGGVLANLSTGLGEVVLGQSGGEQSYNNGQIVYADSIKLVSAGAIPEPSTSLLAGLAGLALVARRRR